MNYKVMSKEALLRVIERQGDEIKDLRCQVRELWQLEKVVKSQEKTIARLTERINRQTRKIERIQRAEDWF